MTKLIDFSKSIMNDSLNLIIKINFENNAKYFFILNFSIIFTFSFLIFDLKVYSLRNMKSILLFFFESIKIKILFRFCESKISFLLSFIQFSNFIVFETTNFSLLNLLVLFFDELDQKISNF